MSPRRPLGSDYRRLWTAAGISTLGDGVRLAALPLLAASLTRDPGAVAAVTFAGGSALGIGLGGGLLTGVSFGVQAARTRQSAATCSWRWVILCLRSTVA